MSVTGALLSISGQDITKLVGYEVEYAKLWKDADRNMNGDVRASLIGIFPKLKCKTSIVAGNVVQMLGSLLNQAYFSVSFYDPLTATVITANYYAGDYSIRLRERERNLYHEVAFNLIPTGKR